LESGFKIEENYFIKNVNFLIYIITNKPKMNNLIEAKNKKALLQRENDEQ